MQCNSCTFCGKQVISVDGKNYHDECERESSWCQLMIQMEKRFPEKISDERQNSKTAYICGPLTELDTGEGSCDNSL